MKKIIYIFILSLLVNNLFAQDFLNNDLNGVVAVSSLPTNWQAVPFGDANSQSTGVGQDTPEVTSLTGPNSANGLNGNPYSGTTFVSGLYGGMPVFFFQEGIMQTVAGFNIGCSYNINFFQAVVKQTSVDFLDTAGCWAVYVDNSLIGISLPTVSYEPSGSTSFIWEFRSFSFTASATSHTIKFLPRDDDSDPFTINSSGGLNPLGALRMGIDSIYITSAKGISRDTILCTGQTITLDVTTPSSTYLWQDNSTNSNLAVTQQGTYWVQVMNTCGIITDTFKVVLNQVPIVNFGADTTLCKGETLNLNIAGTNLSYLWQDNSADSVYNILQQGTYWAQVIDVCGNIVTDTINVAFNLLPENDVNENKILCLEDTLILNATISNATYLWQDGTTNPIYAVTQQGTYSVQINLDNCNQTVTTNVELKDCEIIILMPNVFTPNNDGINDYFQPIKINAINNTALFIYNRWGNLLFETNDVGKGWDGKYNGEECIDGVYFWMIKYSTDKEDSNVLKGFVTLIN